MTARTARLRDKSSGKVYWVEHRIGFAGREFNFGGGWRATLQASREAAEKSGTLNEVKPVNT